MPILEGASGALVDVGVAAAIPVHVTSKPIPYGGISHRRIGVRTGVLNAGLSDSEILQWKWNDATRLCHITRIEISAAVTTTFFAAGVPCRIYLTKATNYSTAGTGGQPINVASLLKMRTAGMLPSMTGNGECRHATTTQLGTGTRSLEAFNMAAIVGPGPITGSLDPTIFKRALLFQSDLSNGGSPLALAAAEGFVLRATAPATGTWTIGINISWAEIPRF